MSRVYLVLCAALARADGCFILFDRHVAKNGGSTMSVIMRRLEEHGECVFWQPAGNRDWTRVMSALESTARSRTPPRLCIEAHFAPQPVSRLATLGALRERWRRDGATAGCQLQRVLRVREPLRHYVAFYAQFVTNGRRGAPKRPVGSARRQLGEHFLAWVNRTHDLQSRRLLEGWRPAEPAEGQRRPSSAQGLEQRRREERRALDAVLGEFEVVAPTDRFELTLAQLSGRLGVPMARWRHHVVRPECLGNEWMTRDLEDPRLRKSLEDRVALCSYRSFACAPRLRAQCEDAVRRAAPLDDWLYSRAVADADAAARADPTLASRVAAFANASRGVWRGGAPTRSACVRADVHEQRLAEHQTSPAAGDVRRDYEGGDPCVRGPQAVVQPIRDASNYALVPRAARARQAC